MPRKTYTHPAFICAVPECYEPSVTAAVISINGRRRRTAWVCQRHADAAREDAEAARNAKDAKPDPYRQAVREIVDVLGEKEWRSDTIDEVFRILHDRGLIEADSEGLATPPKEWPV